MKFVVFFFILCLCFTAGILGVKAVKKCSTAQAVQLCKKFIKDIFEALFQPEQPPQPVYPTVVGWDGYRIVPQLVTTEFKKVCANFDVCYLSGYKLEQDNNTVKYKFSVQRKSDCFSDEDLQTLIQKQSEEIVSGLLLTYGYNFPAEALTAVELQAHFLYVAFARTPEGIKQLDAWKQRILRRQALRKCQKHAGELSEEWKNGGNG